MRNLCTRRGFTMIEVMIAVAIIGILASIAIPQFIAYQYRSKRTEALTNVEAIVKSEIAYFGANGVFWSAPPVPAPLPGPKVAWDAVAQAAFDGLGYRPEGAVWYRYDVNTDPGSCGCAVGTNNEALCFTVSAYGDTDGDGSIAFVSYFYTDPTGNWCATGINGNPPPIDPNSGNPVLDRPAVFPAVPGISDDY